MTEHNTKHYKDVEMRLRRYKSVCARINENKRSIDELNDLNHEALFHISKSIVPLMKNSKHYDPIDVFERQIGMLRSYIKADEHEVRAIRKALRLIRNDPYYLSVECKYFREMTDEQSSRELKCSLSTLRRNRSRLINVMCTSLYGRG